MRNGPTETAIPIGEPVILVAEDLERLREHRFVPTTPQKLRDSHHMVARLAATGLTPTKIAQQVGYGRERVNSLLASPAMQELVANYRAKVDEAFVENVDEFFNLATQNMLRSERMIADALEDAEESGERPSLRTLDAISQGRQDRFGYGKKSQVTNLNVDFAAQLEKAIKRSGKTIEAGPGSVARLSPRPPAQDARPRILRRA